MKKCNIKDIVKVKANYSEALYSFYKEMRFGIKACCTKDLDKWSVKNRLVDLDALYDPDLCVDLTVPSTDCCPQPCNVVVNLLLPTWTACPEPTGVIASLTL